MNKVVPAVLLVTVALLAIVSIVPTLAVDRPDIRQRIFIHYAKGKLPNPPSAEGRGYYKLIGAKWLFLPIVLEVNPSGCGTDENLVWTAMSTAAEEWDDGDYSGWGGVKTNLFAGGLVPVDKSYNDLAWTADKRDGCNTIVWGDYPTSGVIAVTILWYIPNLTILEFDIVFDINYAWGDANITPSVMDVQNIATHELGHGAGLDDLYDAPAYRETMYGRSAPGEIIKRDLYKGDKQGITKLYA
nr:hypothetical protein [Candidatus Njordarchaeum guaymaensis]